VNFATTTKDLRDTASDTMATTRSMRLVAAGASSPENELVNTTPSHVRCDVIGTMSVPWNPRDTSNTTQVTKTTATCPIIARGSSPS